MWECPDVIGLSGKKFLSFSPQGMRRSNYSHQNVYSSGYLNGKEFIEWDYGFDFYAPQTFTAPDGRVLLIGWMGIGDIPYANPTAEMGWQHCLTVPRELTLCENGEIRQNPVSELLSLRRDAKSIGRRTVVKAELPFELDGNTNDNFFLETGSFSLSHSDNVFKLEFNDMNVSGGRTIRRVKLNSLKNIRILADTSSLEIYINNGERVMSSRFYQPDTETEFALSGFEGFMYHLNGINVMKGTENE